MNGDYPDNRKPLSRNITSLSLTDLLTVYIPCKSPCHCGNIFDVTKEAGEREEGGEGGGGRGRGGEEGGEDPDPVVKDKRKPSLNNQERRTYCGEYRHEVLTDEGLILSQYTPKHAWLAI